MGTCFFLGWETFLGSLFLSLSYIMEVVSFWEGEETPFYNSAPGIILAKRCVLCDYKNLLYKSGGSILIRPFRFYKDMLCNHKGSCKWFLLSTTELVSSLVWTVQKDVVTIDPLRSLWLEAIALPKHLFVY